MGPSYGAGNLNLALRPDSALSSEILVVTLAFIAVQAHDAWCHAFRNAAKTSLVACEKIGGAISWLPTRSFGLRHCRTIVAPVDRSILLPLSSVGKHTSTKYIH